MRVVAVVAVDVGGVNVVVVFGGGDDGDVQVIIGSVGKLADCGREDGADPYSVARDLNLLEARAPAGRRRRRRRPATAGGRRPDPPGGRIDFDTPVERSSTRWVPPGG